MYTTNAKGKLIHSPFSRNREENWRKVADLNPRQVSKKPEDLRVGFCAQGELLGTESLGEKVHFQSVRKLFTTVAVNGPLLGLEVTAVPCII